MLTLLFGALLLLPLAVLAFLIVRDEYTSHPSRFVSVVLDDGSPVLVRIIFSSSLARLFSALFNTYTLTFPRRIYCAGEHLVNRGVRHELQHVRQWHRLGTFGFLGAYFTGLVTAGFRDNPLEQEARRAAATLA